MVRGNSNESAVVAVLPLSILTYIRKINAYQKVWF